MEARGSRSLPLAARRQVARAVEQDPGIDGILISEGSVILIQCKSARKDVEVGLRRLRQDARWSPIRKRYAVRRYTGVLGSLSMQLADMLSQGATVTEILQGYPALTREKVELAPLYVKAFPRRGRPAMRSWAKHPPRRLGEPRLGSR
jgi:hypothetical protein